MNEEKKQDRYEQMYDNLLSRALEMHDSNKRRIRRGLIGLVILPAVLGFTRWFTGSDKIVFLIIWIICMFILCAYLMTIEYLDESIQKAMEEISDTEAEFDGLLMDPEQLSGKIQDRISEKRQERENDRERVRARLRELVAARRAARGIESDDAEDSGEEELL